MSKSHYAETVSLEPGDHQRLAILCGQFNENIHQIESQLHIKINNRGNQFTIVGPKHSAFQAGEVLKALYDRTATLTHLQSHDVNLAISHLHTQTEQAVHAHINDSVIHTFKKTIQARNRHQHEFMRAALQNDINFAIGPAGTGKTYLAVACAVQALQEDKVQRIVLVRPAVEAGERLGFLPGDMAEKVNPYLQPLYDALFEMLGAERTDKLLEKNIIEIAPLAYMRGRNLNNAFVILDEAQNTSLMQMKMFLTRIGFGSHAVITGDVTQIDLAPNQPSGLIHAIKLLRDIKQIHFTFYDAADIVRHPLVQLIIDAYESEKQ